MSDYRRIFAIAPFIRTITTPDMAYQFDVIVIGGGIAGISAAAELAASAKVLVLETEDQPGYHATGRSAAYFAPSYGNDVVRGITQASESFFRSPPDGFCDSDLIHPRSAVFIAREDQAEALGRLSKEQEELLHLDQVSLNHRLPILKAGYAIGGLWDDRGGDIEVNTLLQGYLKLLRARGGVIQTGQQVLSIDDENDIWRLTTATHEFSAALLVNAAGAWADNIAEMAGLTRLGLQPKRRSVILIDQPAGYDISQWPLFIDIDEAFYFKPDAGQLLISPANEDPSEPCDSRPEELEIAIAVDRFEKATGHEVSKINHSWAGLRTFASDKSFVAGFDPGCERFYWLAGQGGYGVQSAPGLAKLCSAQITGMTLDGPFTGVLAYQEHVTPRRFFENQS